MQNKYFCKIPYENHKMQKLDAECESVEKNLKNSPKRSYKTKTFAYRKKSKTSFFSVTFLLVTFSHIQQI
jgi:hypothetical protein